MLFFKLVKKEPARVPESVRILLVVFSVPPSLALRLELIHFRVVLFRLFEVLREQVVDLCVVAGLLALRILSVLICKLGFFLLYFGPMRLKSALLRYDTQVKRGEWWAELFGAQQFLSLSFSRAFHSQNLAKLPLWLTR